MKIEGSVALVTGANRGIGKAIAEELLARGASKVYAGVRDVGTITDPRLTAVKLDVTDAGQVAAVAEELRDVEIVVNNAGIARPATPLAASLTNARSELETNYLGLVTMTQAFAPVLSDNHGGAFVNVLSVASWVGMPTLSTYSASKAAAWSFTNSARIELARQATAVIGVHVGYVDTDLTAGLEADKVAPQVVAISALDALEHDRPEAIVDEFSQNIKAALHDDHRLIYPTIQQQFDAAPVA